MTDIVLHFADAESGKDIGTTLVLETRFIEVTNFEDVPEYAPPAPEKQRNALAAGPSTAADLALYTIYSEPNKNYFRQLITYHIVQSFFRPIRFWLRNRGGVGARDVYLDINIQSKSGNLVVVSKDKVPTTPPSKTKSTIGLLSTTHPTKPEEVIRTTGDSWRTQMEFRALQPKREISPIAQFVIGAREGCDVTIAVRIYADTLAEPVEPGTATPIECYPPINRGG